MGTEAGTSHSPHDLPREVTSCVNFLSQHLKDTNQMSICIAHPDSCSVLIGWWSMMGIITETFLQKQHTSLHVLKKKLKWVSISEFVCKLFSNRIAVLATSAPSLHSYLILHCDKVIFDPTILLWCHRHGVIKFYTCPSLFAQPNCLNLLYEPSTQNNTSALQLEE